MLCIAANVRRAASTADDGPSLSVPPSTGHTVSRHPLPVLVVQTCTTQFNLAAERLLVRLQELNPLVVAATAWLFWWGGGALGPSADSLRHTVLDKIAEAALSDDKIAEAALDSALL